MAHLGCTNERTAQYWPLPVSRSTTAQSRHNNKNCEFGWSAGGWRPVPRTVSAAEISHRRAGERRSATLQAMGQGAGDVRALANQGIMGAMYGPSLVGGIQTAQSVNWGKHVQSVKNGSTIGGQNDDVMDPIERRLAQSNAFLKQRVHFHATATCIQPQQHITPPPRHLAHVEPLAPAKSWTGSADVWRRSLSRAHPVRPTDGDKRLHSKLKLPLQSHVLSRRL